MRFSHRQAMPGLTVQRQFLSQIHSITSRHIQTIMQQPIWTIQHRCIRLRVAVQPLNICQHRQKVSDLRPSKLKFTVFQASNPNNVNYQTNSNRTLRSRSTTDHLTSKTIKSRIIKMTTIGKCTQRPNCNTLFKNFHHPNEWMVEERQCQRGNQGRVTGNFWIQLLSLRVTNAIVIKLQDIWRHLLTIAHSLQTLKIQPQKRTVLFWCSSKQNWAPTSANYSSTRNYHSSIEPWSAFRKSFSVKKWRKTYKSLGKRRRKLGNTGSSKRKCQATYLGPPSWRTHKGCTRMPCELSNSTATCTM